MANLNITEYSGILAYWTTASAQMVVQPSVTVQNVAIAGASAQSAAFNANTNIIRINTDAICAVLVGSSPTALTSSTRLVVGQTEYFGVKAGDKIAVIATT